MIGPVGTNTLVRANYITVTNLPPELDLSPNSLSFGSVIIGQTNLQTFQVVNSGGVTLTGAVSTTAPFAIQSGSSLNLVPGQTGTVSVIFAPVSPGNFSNAVIFVSNGGNSTNALSGVGLTPPELGVIPASINFGLLRWDPMSRPASSSPTTAARRLMMGWATIDGAPFAIVSGSPFNLPGYGATNLVVSFAPGDAENYSDVVILTTGNGGNSTNVLSGTGAFIPTANFTANPTSGLSPLIVTFSDLSTGDHHQSVLGSWRWHNHQYHLNQRWSFLQQRIQLHGDPASDGTRGHEQPGAGKLHQRDEPAAAIDLEPRQFELRLNDHRSNHSAKLPGG